MTKQEIVKISKALSVDSRLQILKSIRDKELCVNAITQKLNITQSAVSQHLSVLKEANLVRSNRYGSIIHYSMNAGRLDDYRKGIERHLGKGHAKECHGDLRQHPCPGHGKENRQ
jgi:DNA-binding transcriptional ArsR family regulator